MSKELDDEVEPAPQRSEPPVPVDGDEIELSHTTTIWIVIGCVVLGIAGALTLWLWFRGVFFAPADAGSPGTVPLILGLFGTFVPPVFAVVLIQKLWAGRRLVIGEDRIQIVEGRDDAVQVVVQVPFANIESLKYTRIDFGSRLDIELADVHDPETYLPGANIEVNYVTWGYHYTITEPYELPKNQILARINRVRKRWRKSRGEV